MPYLRIYNGGTLLEQRQLSAALTTIGRTEDNDIVLPSHGVSKHHATIERTGEAFVLRDSDSANGTYVEGKRISRYELKYWDEIQVFDFVLKFMAVARLKGEELGTSDRSQSARPEDATIEVDISSLGDLARLRSKIMLPSLLLLGRAREPERYALDKVNFTLGKSEQCDIKTPGWFSPGLAARIQRHGEGCFVLPGWRGGVAVNGQRVRRRTRLNDGDELRVRGLCLRFEIRPMDGG